eukprot:TRINITY_DN1415_c0_g1_i1.p1 TRINITY_DN1415_c0_g1~~TRINITY_DN1415_c0_g1_i1.p1  ORF type:complete len:290 (-),score=97.12 TRINITY_DN1415_c0_g1_i1:212-1081(-)
MADSDEHVPPPAKTSHPKKNATSVADYGMCSDQNSRYRRRMEDAHFLQDGFNNDPSSGIFAVYDGHGGKDAAVFCSTKLHTILAEELNAAGGKDFYNNVENSEKVLQVITDTYLKTDKAMEGVVPTNHGCTVVTSLVTGSLADDNRQLFTANAGDGRAVLCRDGQALRLTVDHKASNAEEAKRITDAGGFIIGGRVNAQIIITRSLGDHAMKDYIIGTPHLHHAKLNDKDTWLIVACDGLWDVVSDQDAVDFVLERQEQSCSDIAKELLIKALNDGSNDNLSICVVRLV